MTSAPESPVPPSPLPERPSRTRRSVHVLFALLLVYGCGAYMLLPTYWKHYFHKHPALDSIPGITLTKVGLPGDPVNVALIGTQADLTRVMLRAGWYPADPITLKSSLEIAADTVFRRPYDDAPVSSLYLFGRKEDLAFEKPVGHDPKQRNHVRFWKSDKLDPDGRPVWIGAGTFDHGVGLSHTTGEITHHISADVDAERELLFTDLQQTGMLSEIYTVPGFHKTLSGKNGGGDPWHTDGALKVGVIAPTAAPPREKALGG